MKGPLVKCDNTRLKRSINRKVNKAMQLAAKREKTNESATDSRLNGKFKVQIVRG